MARPDAVTASLHDLSVAELEDLTVGTRRGL